MPRRSPIQRLTILLDAAGVVRKAWKKASVDGRHEDVLSALPALEALD